MFHEKEVEFISINDNIGTITLHGGLIFNIFASFSEIERELISERTKAGLEAARAKGRMGRRKPGLSKESVIKAYAAHTLSNQDWSVSKILSHLNISKSTYYRYLERAKNNLPTNKKWRSHKYFKEQLHYMK